MRKIIYALAVGFVGLGLNSCDAWEDESYHESSSVILPGVWKLTELNLETPYDFNGDGTSNTNLMVETNCYQNELMSFLPNNNGIISSTSYAFVSIDGENFSVECIEETEDTSFEWSQEENNVSILIGEATMVGTLNGNKLTYVIPEGFYASNEEGSVEILQDITFVYTKQ